MRRISGPAVLVVLAACASGAAGNPQFVATRPIPETMDCLATALDSAGYKVTRLDRRRGQLEARHDDDTAEKGADMREFKRGDRLEFDLGGDKKTFTVKPSGYRELRSRLGNETEFLNATERSKADAATLSKRCGG